ncbi:MAG: hypothetical protein U0414_39725 [Polyangiaceae bacterium]
MTTQGGPPPGWPVSAVPRPSDASIAAVPVSADAPNFAFPPVDPGFKRGAPSVAQPLHTAVTQPDQALAQPAQPIQLTEPDAGSVAGPWAGAPPPSPAAAAAPPPVVAESAPNAVAAGPIASPLTAVVSTAPRVATPPPKQRSRVAVLAAIGAVLIAGTAIGSFLYLRSSTASPTTDASAHAARPKKGGKKAPAAPTTSVASADEPVVEDTPPPKMQTATAAESAAPTATAESTARPSLNKRGLPLRRLNIQTKP